MASFVVDKVADDCERFLGGIQMKGWVWICARFGLSIGGSFDRILWHMVGLIDAQCAYFDVLAVDLLVVLAIMHYGVSF